MENITKNKALQDVNQTQNYLLTTQFVFGKGKLNESWKFLYDESGSLLGRYIDSDNDGVYEQLYLFDEEEIEQMKEMMTSNRPAQKLQTLKSIFKNLIENLQKIYA